MAPVTPCRHRPPSDTLKLSSCLPIHQMRSIHDPTFHVCRCQGEPTHIEMTGRRTLVACLFALAYGFVYWLVCFLLPPESTARTAFADLGTIVLELALVGLCWTAYRKSRGDSDRWIWLLLGGWAIGNLLGDALWTSYELVRQVDVPTPSFADAGYLFAYAFPIAVILVANWRTLGRLKALENTIDAAILTLGAAGLAWPLVLEPLFAEYSGDLSFWVNFSYPVLGILLIFAFVSLLFGYYDNRQRRPPAYFVLVCLVFSLQIVADSAYFFVVQSAGGEYVTGSWLDAIWTASYAVGCIAALLGIRALELAKVKRTLSSAGGHLVKQTLPAWRTAAPYMTLPVLAAMVSMQTSRDDWRWDLGTSVLVYMGVVMVVLLIARQYVALLRNRSLYADLADISTELEKRVADLADFNARLEDLNDSSRRLTGLCQPHAVARAGLEMACKFTGSLGGWISIGEGADYTVVTYGAVDHYPHSDAETVAAAEDRGILRSVPLTVRGENLGTMLLLERSGHTPSTDLTPLVAAQLASALDNARRYEEALQLAEKDPLTGLYNHRGIHRRLAGETLRAQQSDSDLSLIMIDLDDFKVLNDTYGHVAGDSVLRQVSDAIRAVLRHADLAGRVGGDELLLVLPNTGTEGAMQLSERLRVALAARPYLNSGGQPIPVYLSLGVASMPDDAQSVGQLLEIADSRLYSSKQRGGNTTTGAVPDMAESAESRRGVLGIAERLLDAVGARDHYTRRHSEHVVRNALALGEAIGLHEDSLRTLHIAAMLHDVGNIGVSPDLLRRPGSLNESEEERVRDHVFLGSEIVTDIPRLAEVAAAVSAHHERYDGAGYPAHTAAEEIPLLGRVLAVADAYSAMTMDRPYRKSMPRAQAKEELLKSAGTQLDPRLVDAFINVLDARDDDATGEQAAAC